ncbi:MAG: isochorismatase family protein [Verrucomicrobiota bacterium]
MSSWRSDPGQSAILLVDIQEKLFPTMHQKDTLLTRASVLCQVASILSVPVYITEQVPEKLGATLSDLKDTCTPEAIWAKQTFSAHPVLAPAAKVKHWVVAGIEAHICVRQTVLDMHQQGHAVTVLADVITSRHVYDRDQVLAEFRAMGIRVQTLEALLFEWLETSQHAQFREISRLVRDL